MRVMDVMLAFPGLLLAIGIVAALGPGPLADHGRRRSREHPDLRPAAARLRAGPARERLRARRALGRRAAAHDPRVAHPPELDLAADRRRGRSRSRRRSSTSRASASSGSGRRIRPRRSGGRCSSDADRYLQSAPYLAIFPGVAIVLSVLGFNLIGDGLREALDPKLRGAHDARAAPLGRGPARRVLDRARHGPRRQRDLVRRSSRGETLGIVGESGCGKSVTALRCSGSCPRAGRVTSGRRPSTAATC